MKRRRALWVVGLALMGAWAGKIWALPTLEEWQSKEFDLVDLKDEKYRLTEEEVKTLTPDREDTRDPGQKIRQLYPSQTGLENLYGRLKSGPIPDGEYKGSVILPREGRYEVFFKIAELFGFPFNRTTIELLMQRVWRGKTFDKKHLTLMNQIVLKSELAFPAKVFCGISLFDKTEPSVIIDYAFSDDLGVPLYEELRDKIVTRHGIRIRDEVRMISPGFYLGRAYMDGAFALNFALFRAGETARANECGESMPAKTAGLVRSAN